MTLQNEDVIGVVLAGGRARRMGGGDKCRLEIEGSSLLVHGLQRLAPQVETMILNTNGEEERFASFRLPVVVDPIDDYAGPLAGVLAGMRWAERHRVQSRHIVTIASDTPFFPRDLVSRLVDATVDKPDAIALATSNGGLHPVFGLWPVALADDLQRALEAGVRKARAFAASHKMIEVRFEGYHRNGEEIDPFFNINSPEDLDCARELAKHIK